MKKMSPLSKSALILGFTLLAALILVRVTGIVSVYSIPTPSNSPTLKEGSYFLASNIPTPQRYDFVLYDVVSPTEDAVYVKRLCGLPDDRIEMKDGVLFVNGENFDKNLNLNLCYTAPTVIADKYRNAPGTENFGSLGDSAVLIGSSATFSKISSFKRVLDRRNAELSPDLGGSAGLDQFGPIVVPKGKIFVLGDNRYNSLDSRYRGFVDVKNIRGVKIW